MSEAQKELKEQCNAHTDLVKEINLQNKNFNVLNCWFDNPPRHFPECILISNNVGWH